MVEERVAWRIFINLKYGAEQAGAGYSKVLGRFLWGWKEIGKEAVQLQQNAFLEVGDGFKVRFWEDRRYGEASL